MKKLWFCALSLLFACSSRASFNTDTEVASFIRTCYDTRQYEDTAFLQSRCTPELLAKLRAAYDYEGPGYATWLFRSGKQDGPDSRYGITSLEQEGDWVTYEALDMGVAFCRSVRIVRQDGRLYMADVCGFEPVGAATFKLISGRKGLVIVDVRTAAEFAEGHIDGALNIDIQQDNFKAKVQQMLRPDQTLAIYCRSGRRSKTAARTLSTMGFSGYELEDGYLSYLESGN